MVSARWFVLSISSQSCAALFAMDIADWERSSNRSEIVESVYCERSEQFSPKGQLTIIMPYPKQIITMAQNFINEREENVQLQETRFYMLWNTILNLHFPFTLGYGMAPQTHEAKFLRRKDYSRVGRCRRRCRAEELLWWDHGRDGHIAGRVGWFINERFSQTRYPTIYGIGGVGLSWTALKVDKIDFDRLMIIVPRRGNVTSNESFSRLKVVADEIYAMTRVWP